MKLGMRELWPLLGPSGPSVHLLLLVAACVFCLLSSLGKLLVHCNFPWQLHQDPCCEGCHSFTVEAKHLFSCTETLWKMLLLLASRASLYQLHVWSLYLWTVFCIGHNHPSILFYHCHHWVHLSYHCPSYCCFPRFLWYVFLVHIFPSHLYFQRTFNHWNLLPIQTSLFLWTKATYLTPHLVVNLSPCLTHLIWLIWLFTHPHTNALYYNTSKFHFNSDSVWLDSNLNEHLPRKLISR